MPPFICSAIPLQTACCFPEHSPRSLRAATRRHQRTPRHRPRDWAPVAFGAVGLSGPGCSREDHVLRTSVCVVLTSLPQMSASCVGCARMRDELVLVRHQLTTHRAAAGTMTTPAAADTPPLLYQLQKHVPRRQPEPAPTMVAHRQPSSSPNRSPRTTARPPATVKVKSTAASHAVPKQQPDVADNPTQTFVSDLAPHALAGAVGCNRCVCCTLSHSQHEALVLAREEWRTKYDDSVDRNRVLEAEVTQLVHKLRALRADLQAQQQPSTKSQPNATDLRAAEQEKVIQLLRQQHEADQKLLERLQLQVNQFQRSPPSISKPSGASHLDGLSALQRHQLEIRSSAEQALLRLQQLFPDQSIGT